MIMKLLSGLILCLFMASYAMATIVVKGHPLIKPYPGSKVWESSVNEFDRVVLPTGKLKYDASANAYVAASSIKTEGKVTAIDYRTDRQRSALEVLENYKQGLTGGGFELLYNCYEGDCGSGRPFEKYLGGSVGYKQTGLVTAKLARADGDVFVSVLVDQHNAHNYLLVVEAKPMQSGLVKVDADALLNDIERTGHASIYGIYFDTDKSDVKPESRQALGEIARLLKNKPDLKLYVVGHTDNVGSLSYNKKLSMSRAAAVVAVLVKDYGIDPSRLQSEGVGPLAPVLANTSDAGRAKNRRVELVTQ